MDTAHRDFDEFYGATFHGLRSQLYAYLGDRAEAQDVVQEAFCRAFARWKTISGYDDLLAADSRVLRQPARQQPTAVGAIAYSGP